MSTQSSSSPSDSVAVRPLSFLEAGIMAFLIFDGLFLLSWLYAMSCGYDQTVPAVRISLYATALSVPLYLFVIGRRFKDHGFRALPGLTWAIFLFLALFYIRLASENWYLGKPTGIISGLVFPIIFAAFAVPLDKKSERTMFYVFFLVLWVFALLLAGNWYHWILDGVTVRGTAFFKSQNLIEGVWGRMDGAAIFAIAHTGAMLGLLAFSGWTLRKIHWALFLVTYTFGMLLICFAACRSVLIAWCLCHLIIFLAGGLWKQKISLLIIPILLIINGVLLVEVGKKDQYNNMLLRTTKTFKSADKTGGHIQESIRQVSMAPVRQVSMAPESGKTMTTKETKKKYELVRNPLEVRKNHPVKHGMNAYSIIARAEGVESRAIILSIALTLIRENPVFGYGTMIVVRIGEDYFTMSPHSNVLCVLLATGCVGGLLLVILVFTGMRDSYFICRYHSEYAWLVVLWTYGFVVNLFGTNIMADPLFWIPLIALHAVVVTHRNERIASSSAVPSFPTEPVPVGQTT